MLKHEASLSNCIVDVPSRRHTLLVKMLVIVSGFDLFMELYCTDQFFAAFMEKIRTGQWTNFVM